MFNNIKEALISLEKRKKFNGLALFKQCIEHIGNPQYQLKCIHVAGTNGKGSTSNYIAHMLATKYKVGLFSSPHLVNHNERIRIQNKPISDQQLLYYINKTYPLWETYQLSMFEIDMLISIFYFLDQDVDFVVYEVGMGGEKDATNVISSIVSVITNIAFDHEKILGSTLEEIATTKAGIIKKDQLFITGETNEKCLHIFDEICQKQNSKLVQSRPSNEVIQQFPLQFNYVNKIVTLPTIANYQIKNATLALDVVAYLHSMGVINLSIEKAIESLKNCYWSGRMQVIHKNPMIIIDGAHNLNGVEALLQTTKQFNNVKVLFSAVNDKPISKMLDQILKVHKEVYVCDFDFYRCASKEKLLVNDQIKWTTLEKFLLDHQKFDGILLICGSLYFIGSVMKKLKGGKDGYTISNLLDLNNC